MSGYEDLYRQLCGTGIAIGLCPAFPRYILRRLSHLEDFFTQDSDDLESYFRIGLQKIKQRIAGDKLETTIALGLGSKAVRFSREGRGEADNASCSDCTTWIQWRMV